MVFLLPTIPSSAVLMLHTNHKVEGISSGYFLCFASVSFCSITSRLSTSARPTTEFTRVTELSQHLDLNFGRMASAKLVAPVVAVCALISVLLVASPWHVESAAIASEGGDAFLIPNFRKTIDGVSVMLDPVNDKKVLSQLASAKTTAEDASKAFKP
ncbi:unnamed protein product [Closterium sp. NIES-53]